MTFISITLLSGLLLPLSLFAQHDITKGTWFNEAQTGRVQFFVEDSKLHGKVVWFWDAGRKDRNNPDPELQDRAIIGLVNLTGFTTKDNKTWTGGKIYDPESGKTYSSKITVINKNELFLRGYIGTPLLGRTTRLTRADQ